MKQKQHRYRNRHLAVRGLQKNNNAQQQQNKFRSQAVDYSRSER